MKNRAELAIKARVNDGKTTQDVNLFAVVDKDLIEQHPKEIMEANFKRDLETVRFQPLSGIFNGGLDFSYGDPSFLKDFDFGNLLLDVHLPYCLHLPNNYEFEVILPEFKEKVLLIHRKVWTKKAKENDIKKSSNVDFFAEDKVTYFNTSTTITPMMPVDPELGWQQDFVGTNIENIKDQNGNFRYSSLYIQFQKDVSADDLNTEIKRTPILNEIKEIALSAVNRLIDSYRATTRNGYVQRLGNLGVNSIYFIDLNVGYYIFSSGFGLETAVMNRSKKEITEIEEALEKDKRPELYDLLLLDSQVSFENKDLPLAVVQSFQALEIYLENFITTELMSTGKTETEITEYLEKNWRTKMRLKEVLIELKGTSLFKADQKLWNKWCTLYDQTRNEVVHKGKYPTQQEVAELLTVNNAVISWLQML